ncbi:CCA tRNA nucleotidyltransferase [Brevibacillus daliensis]|uniref:CCA tRNA nucleotidyltransferase n=1 Tax=Brevibacillus daliensis TaxID=2892995 RepID=UPI001E412A6F|nr:CCA tRNA nucleotidyltransferase [Brevibacillus daliensis]
MRETAKLLIKSLEKNGYEAYFVGGCVRDWLLHRPVHDIDICTNALPEDIMRIFPDHIPTGLKHGTITVKMNGGFFEVTTFRTDGMYDDHRRPTEVYYVKSIVEDLARRDFTINAMAMTQSKEVIDPFFGANDLNDRLIRAVGNASRRFEEDALRLVRGVRFAAQLGFRIEEETQKAMQEKSGLLAYIAMERIREECNKIIGSKHPEKAFEASEVTNLFQAFPLLDRIFGHSWNFLWRLQSLQNLEQKWMFLMYGATFTASEIEECCQFLKMSRKEKESITTLGKLVDQYQVKWDQPKQLPWKQLLMNVGYDLCQDLEQLIHAIWFTKQQEIPDKSVTVIYNEMSVQNIKDLMITGADIVSLRTERPGSWVHETLQHLFQQAVLYDLKNERNILLVEAERYLERIDQSK